MATSSIRIREPAETSGTIAVNAAARKYQKYGVTRPLIISWVKKGEVVVAKAAAFTGDTVLLDEASLRRRIALYSPHGDNRARQPRRRTIPEMQVEARARGVSNGHRSASIIPAARAGSATAPGASRPATPAGGRSNETVLLNTREWLDHFYTFQARGSGDGELNAETKDSYDWTFERFAKRFPTLPMGRKQIFDYIHGLTDLKKGGPLSGSSKALAHRNLSTLYHWLKREHTVDVPNLEGPRITQVRKQALPIWPDEIRAVLSMVGNHSEKTIVMLLAQTACRIGELCTMRPELLHDHWIEVWGKGTKANSTGYRKVAIPDEAYKDLLLEFGTYKKLVWVDGHGEVKPLAGPLEAIKPWSLDLRDPKTYRVRRRKASVSMLQGMMRRLMRDAGVYQPGKSAHSFRRSYQAQFVKSGGSREFYRLIMGHFNVKNMDDLYTHASIEDIVAQARQYAPRSFLKESAPQGELDLELDSAEALSEFVDDDDDEDEEED